MRLQAIVVCKEASQGKADWSRPRLPSVLAYLMCILLDEMFAFAFIPTN